MLWHLGCTRRFPKARGCVAEYPFFKVTVSLLFGKRRSRGLLHRKKSSVFGGSLYRRKRKEVAVYAGDSLHRLILYGEVYCLAFIRAEKLVIYTEVFLCWNICIPCKRFVSFQGGFLYIEKFSIFGRIF